MKISPHWIAGFVLLLAISLGATSRGQTQAQAPQNVELSDVAVLDLVRVFDETNQIKDLNAKIQKKTDDITNEIKARKDALDIKRAELQKGFRPGTPDYEQRSKELMELQIEAEVWLEVAQRNLEKEKFDWTLLLYEQAGQAAATIARQRGFRIVLQRKELQPEKLPEATVMALRRAIQERDVIYHAPETDITDLVIDQLNASYSASQTAPANPQPSP